MSTIGQLSTAVYRNMQLLVGSRLCDVDISTGQYDFFYVIARHEGATQTQISAWLRVGKSTTAKAVKRLVAKGYVEKRKNERDGRVDHLYLTERGRAIAPRMAELFRENIAVSLRGLSEAEEAQLLALLARVLENLVAENRLGTEANGDE